MNCMRTTVSAAVLCLPAALWAQEATPLAEQDLGTKRLQEVDDQANRPTFEFSTDYASKYVSKGVVVNDDPVVQPSATASWRGFSLNIWGSIDTTDYNDREWDFQELDYTLSYEHTVSGLPLVESLTLGGGYIFYDFPGTGEETQELFVEAACADLLLAPAVTVYYDCEDADGFYINPRLEPSIPLIEDQLSLDFMIGTSWGDANYNRFNFGDASASPGWVDLSASVALTWQVTETFSVAPFVATSQVLDGALRNSSRENGSSVDQYWCGLNATLAF